MSQPSNPRKDEPVYPRPWKYVMGAILAFPLLVCLWLLLVYWLHPEVANADTETTMDRLRAFGMPLIVVIALFGGKFLFDSLMAYGRHREWEQTVAQVNAQEAAAHATAKARREYVLEVMGLGVTFEKYRQGKLWDALQQGGAYTTIRETDPEKYPWMDIDKKGQSGGRACDALENGADPSPMFWGVPTFYAGSPNIEPILYPIGGLGESAETTGMAWHLFVTGPWELSEQPDRLLEKVFAYFDAYPDLPYVLLLADDSSSIRDSALPIGAPRIVKTGHYIPEMPDTTTVFVLARRERVEPLRPYVWEDPDSDYLQDNLRMLYYDLKTEAPNPYPPDDEYHLWHGRNPTVEEWLHATASFAKNPVYQGEHPTPIVSAFDRLIHRPPKDWTPTPWFPVPWNQQQMHAFDRLPSLGYIHRPVFVKYEDEHGKPVVRRDARQKLLETGWQHALQTLSDAERAAAPQRIIAAFGNSVDQQIAFEHVLRAHAAQGGPEIDSGTPRYINTDKRLGNTGAATFFMQMAIGVMGSYIEGGTSAAINLRDPTGASFVFVSPPSPERLKEQEFRDVFKHKVQPAIDPNNYKPPTMSDVAEAQHPRARKEGVPTSP